MDAQFTQGHAISPLALASRAKNMFWEGQKTVREKEKILYTNIFFFSNNAFSRLLF